MPALSKSIGMRLETNSQTANEVLLIQVKDVAAKDVLDRIAKVADAQWKQEKDILRLVRPITLVHREEKAELQARIDLYRHFFEILKKTISSRPAWTLPESDSLLKTMQEASDAQVDLLRKDGFTTFKAMLSEFPAVRAINSLLFDLGAEALAKIGENERVVYAIHPNAMQLSLGPSAESILTKFASEQKPFVEAYKQPGRKKFGGRYPSNWFDFDSLQLDQKADLANGLGQAILVVRRLASGPDTSLRANLIVADGRGGTLGYGNSTYELASMVPKPPLSDHQTPIELGKLEKELLKAYRKVFIHRGVMQASSMLLPGTKDWIGFSKPFPDPPRTSDLSNMLVNTMLHPEKNDPLSLIPGEAIAKSADSLHLNLVADLPDTIYSRLLNLFRSEPEIGTSELLNFYLARYGCLTEREENWLIISPARPNEMRTKQVNRIALGELLRSCRSNEGLRLDELSQMAVRQEKPVKSQDIDGLQIRVIFPELFEAAIEAFGRTDQLRILGTLTAAERSLMERNAPIPLGMLTPSQFNWLGDDVFNGESSIEIGGGNSNPFRPASISNERSQALADGIPREGTLKIEASSDNAILATNSLTGDTKDLTPIQLASELLEREYPTVGTAANFDRFLAGRAIHYRMHYDLVPKVTVDAEFRDSAFDMRRRAGALGELPSDILNRVQTVMAAVRKDAMFADRNSSKRQSPPPP